MIVFIIIVSVALAGVLSVLDVVTKNSADPLLRKQMLTIAEALVDEVQMRPFTFCDPDDANAATATSPAGCSVATAQQVFGHKALASRATYDNVGNYCTQTGTDNTACGAVTLGIAGNDGSQIPDISGVGTFSPRGYWATITLAPQALGGIASANNAAGLNVILITVTVASTRTNETVTVQGYRTRWAPNP
jgi:MSHA pilin protein MshD